MMKEHGVFDRSTSRVDTVVGQPISVVLAVLKHLRDRPVKLFAEPGPCGYFFLSRFPVVVARLGTVNEGDDDAETRASRQTHHCNKFASRRLNIAGDVTGGLQVVFLEEKEVCERRFEPERFMSVPHL